MEDEIQPHDEVLDTQQSIEADEELDLELDEPADQEPPKAQSGKKRFEDMEKDELVIEAKRYYAIAKKDKTSPSPKTERPQANSGLTREEAILFAKGHTEEEVDLANKLAKVNGVSLVKAIEDDYFKSVVNNRLKKEKSDRASLGASNGNSKFVPKDVGKMSRDEHQKLFHEVMSKV